MFFHNVRIPCNKKTAFLVIFRHNSKSSKTPGKTSKRFSDTLNLPSTDFTLTAKGGASSRREVEIQKICGFDQLYDWQQNQNRHKEFILHDGPPYANGKPHVGHALNKILKDITNRYKLLRGYQIHYVPGWDCHGLPIELKALHKQSNKNLTPLQIRTLARNYAKETIELQKTVFKRWGVMADWENQCYFTYDPKYEVNQLEIFFKMFEKGLVYQDFMPVYWSPSSRTALAEAELEYNEEHKSKAVYVRFPISKPSAELNSIIGWAGRKLYAVIWTTTPWTLPSNQAICYNKNINYSIVEDTTTSHLYICETMFVEKLREIMGKPLEVLTYVEGVSFDGMMYRNLLVDKDLPFLPAHHVVPGKGTGLVHTAPIHGHEDYHVAQEHGLSLACMVDETGKYTWDAGKYLYGKQVGLDADETVIEMLTDNVLQASDYIHSYPYDWRTKKPVIIRASRQWFVDTKKLKEKAIESLKSVDIRPRKSEQGMLEQLERRTYWCISRQRVWGVPIPVFYHRQTRQPILNRAIINHINSLFNEHGSDCWWNLAEEELIPKEELAKIGLGSHGDFVKGTDILDIWFDSGISWTTLPEDKKADLYMEGIDQFGGWFQSSLLTSIAVRDQVPYKSIVVHDFALDEEGKKMSKSVGNVVDPDVIINGGKNKAKDPSYGADVLRFWVARNSLAPKVLIGKSVLDRCNNEVFEIRKMLRYLLGNLNDFTVDKLSVDYNDLWPQDKYMLHLLYQFENQVTELYEEYKYGSVLALIEKFINSQISAFYNTITKDRMYCTEKDGASRSHCQFVQYHVLNSLVKALAPILPHLTEEVTQYYPWIDRGSRDNSVFKSGWFISEPAWNNPDIEHLVKPVLDIKDDLYSAIISETPAEFDVIINASSRLYHILKELQSEEMSSFSPLTEILQTSTTSITTKQLYVTPDDTLTVDGVCKVHMKDPKLDGLSLSDSGFFEPERYILVISPALKYVCERCRRYTSEHSNTPCKRCLTVMADGWNN